MQASPEPARAGIHPLLRYLRAGINPLPLAVGQKSPYTALVDQWKPLQRERVSEALVAHWIEHGDPKMGIGLVCGKISDLCCLDADLDDFAAWILEHTGSPLFDGCWIVETGSGKVHIWVRAQNVPQVHAWYLRAGGTRCGEVRGEGSYAAAPPSIHPSGGTYRTRKGSPESLAYVDDVESLARDITNAYLEDNPGVQPTPPVDRSHRILELNAEQRDEAASRVKHAGFPRKIVDTLLKPGNQTPGAGLWVDKPSYSEIDWQVVMAFVRKGWDRDEAEWTFAGTLVAAGCYANPHRKGSIGRAYWVTTWDKAEAENNRAANARLVATGANCEVQGVLRLGQVDPLYKITLKVNLRNGGERSGDVTLDANQMMSEKEWQTACLKSFGGVPRWLSSQRGQDFADFVEAVVNMAQDSIDAPRAASNLGLSQAILLSEIRALPERAPRSRGELARGWTEDGWHWLEPIALINAMRAYNRQFRSERIMEVLHSMGDVERMFYSFPDNPADTMQLVRVRLAPAPDVPVVLPLGVFDADS